MSTVMVVSSAPYAHSLDRPPMLPVIALVGRPNVGKSTLFNVLTQTRDALVADYPGLTRDRQYGLGKIGPRPYVVVDTGGLGYAEGLDALVTEQALQAVAQADAIVLLVDGRDGPVSADQDIIEPLRRLDKPIILAANKTEHLDPDIATAEFYSLGLGAAHAISASHKRGIQSLMTAVLTTLPDATGEHHDAASPDPSQGIKLAIVGRPNVGKSTLINRLLGEQRVLAYDQPGTTRDSVAIPFSKHGQDYTLIDTAGVRRRSRVTESIEKFSVIKTLQAIQQAHVAILMVDAQQGISEQDATLLGYVIDSGRALVLAVNKWDHLPAETRTRVHKELDRKLAFIDFAKILFISALHGSEVMNVLEAANQAYAAATRDLATAELTRILQYALARHQPPLVRGQAIKLRYAHQGGRNPPRIVIHGSRTEHVPQSYRRYLAKFFREQLKLYGTPVRIEFNNSHNPYQPAAARPKRKTKAKNA